MNIKLTQDQDQYILMYQLSPNKKSTSLSTSYRISGPVNRYKVPVIAYQNEPTHHLIPAITCEAGPVHH